MATAKATPKLVSVSINYNASMKANLAKVDPKKHAYESISYSDSETRTYNVEGMSEEDVDEFLAAVRLEMVDRVDGYVQGAYVETFS